MRIEMGGEQVNQDLAAFITDERHLDIIPRFAFKKKFQNINGQESFTVNKVDVGSVTKSYTDWAKEEIVKDIKEEMFYITEDPVD